MSNFTASQFDEDSRVVLLVTRPNFQAVFTVIALIIIILLGSFVYVFYPFDGMDISWETNFGTVSVLDPDGPAAQAGVLVGDHLLSIEGQPLNPWKDAPVYRYGIRPGDTLVYEFRRGQEILRIPIAVEGYLENWSWLWPSFLIHFLALSFWAMGAAMCLFTSPNDVRSRLFGLGFLLAGMTAAAGLAGGWNSFWGANTLGIILRIWLGPVYVAAHFKFPDVSLPKYRKSIISVFVAIAIVLTILCLVNALILNPRELSFSTLSGFDPRRGAQIFFVFSWLVGTGLLVYNRVYSKDTEVRRQTGIVLWGNVLGFTPYIVFIVIPYVLFGDQFVGGLGSIAFLVLVPLSYIYVIHQRKLLRLDFIINRFVVLFVLVLLVLVASVLTLGMLALVFDLTPDLPFFGGIVAALFALSSASLQRRVQVRVNRVLYGSYYDFSTVTSGFSSRLAVTLDRKTLYELLTKDLPTQMGIQQSALFLADGDSLVLQPNDVETYSVSLDDAVCQFLLGARNPVRDQSLWNSLSEEKQRLWQNYTWGELFVPMVFKRQLRGVLILGERVTADVYSDTDIQIIATIAYQGALAYANVQLVETLRGLAQQLVRADENQRKRVARDLHDGVLQNLFFVRQQLSEDQVELTGHISNIIDQLRQMINTQRTVLLDQGLKLALQSLVMDMQALAGKETTILWSNAVDGDLNLTDEQATSIYRIVQEAISNALKHAQAEYINVKIEQTASEMLRVSIEDDGIGMPKSDWRNSWEHHYGLVGMKERALMISADLKINSGFGEGTTVLLEIQR